MTPSSNKMTRRQLLLAGGASLFALPIVFSQIFEYDASLTKKVTERFLTALKIDNQHFLSAMDINGIELFREVMPTQLHSICASTSSPKHVIGISRDPEEPAIIIDSQTGKIQAYLTPGMDRHFNGHGCFSADGRFFYASENFYRQEKGSIGVYELSSLKRIASFDTFGQGPHELGFLSDNRTLVVANGGVQTRPESGREELNIATMQPSLVYLDSQSGKLIKQHFLDDHYSSIRHMTIGADDTVGIAIQYKGRNKRPPLVGFQQGSKPITLLKSASDKTHWQMNQYTASISIHPKSGVAGVTSPRGNSVTFWDSRTHRFLKALDIFDPGGISLSQDGRWFFITSGTGNLFHIDADTLEMVDKQLPHWPEAHWGNHFTHLAG